ESERYRNLGGKIQCSCGCNQMLLQCNHVGCPSSSKMIGDLHTTLANYDKDEDVLNWFRSNYGMTVVVSPATHGFELTIWVVPPVVVVTAFVLVFFLVRRWRERAVPVPAMGLDPQMDALRQQARRETDL
ncbi:MAG TPA: cytochrome c-type biogenesis protein CcmH, partial [Candidatus Angelobacter sp.]